MGCVEDGAGWLPWLVGWVMACLPRPCVTGCWPVQAAAGLGPCAACREARVRTSVYCAGSVLAHVPRHAFHVHAAP